MKIGKAKAWVLGNLDVIAFAVALSSVGPLMAWWSVLVRRNILQMDALRRQQFLSLDPVARAGQEEMWQAHTERQLFMITGESALAGLLLLTMAFVLFAVARHRQAANRRMQTTLQLTSHQLKTPVAGVRMLLQSLASGAIPMEQQAKYLHQGIAECDRLEHLVETILAFQRAVVRSNLSRQTVPTESLVGDILKHRKQAAPTEEVAWSQKSRAWVLCDPDAVRVVLENLLDNARKYGGGSVELQEVLTPSRWRLEVRDGGQGFEPRQAESLFEPFERGGGAGVAHGSGLGLHIARQLARRMKGDLWAKSKGPGQGSTFALELPLAQSAEEAATEVVRA